MNVLSHSLTHIIQQHPIFIYADQLDCIIMFVCKLNYTAEKNEGYQNSFDFITFEKIISK